MNPSAPKVKILLFDIETFPNLGLAWGVHEQDLIEIVQPSFMLCFAWKWLGERKTHVVGLPDFPGYSGYRGDKTSDKKLVGRLWKLFDEAAVVCGHNSFAFDVKRSNARFIKYGFPPPAPFQQVDTLKVARKHFKFESNRLNDLGTFLDIGNKAHTGGWPLWKGCYEGKMSSWRTMKRYNQVDVQLLERVYLKLRPWMDNHPNFNVYNDTQHKCPNCGGNIQRSGYRVTRTTKYQRYHCTKCGAWSQRPLTKGVVR